MALPTCRYIHQLGRVLSEWELWACANKLIEQHGRDAVLHAGRRRLELEEEGDEAGAVTWALILIKVIELLRPPKSEDELQ